MHFIFVVPVVCILLPVIFLRQSTWSLDCQLIHTSHQLVSEQVPPNQLTPRRDLAKITSMLNLEKISAKYKTINFKQSFSQERKNKCINKNDCYHTCGKPIHFIKYCPLHKLDYKDYIKNNHEKARNKNRVLISSNQGQLQTMSPNKPWLLLETRLIMKIKMR